MSASTAVRRVVARVPSRAFSAPAANPLQVDWASVRAKMLTDETRAECDRARDAFHKRMLAAENVGEVSSIDWAYYAKALPELNIAAMQKDFEAAVATIPPVVYDDAADKKAHESKEAAWTSFAAYCAQRVKELEVLKAEQSKHKLHRWYRRRQLYARFPGLYESLHHKVRGAWDVDIWANYLAYRAGNTPVPWDPHFGEVDAEKKKQLMQEIATKAGVKPEELGWKL